MTCDDVISKFFAFFKKHDHILIPGASLVPQDDPTLLFINSGMAPLKPYFLGKKSPPYPNLCNIQPCIRTVDIDIVGDRHHLTMFEMLGSWSIGKYWKETAIELAYELLIDGFGYDPKRIYATVYAGNAELNIPPDEVSPLVWERMGLPRDHIVPLGEDNFWGPAGKYGPCGPCTEVFFDTGDKHGVAYTPGKHFDTESRYIEIWNAGVFMEFDKQPSGLERLKLRSVDTGSGLERMLMNLNQVDSVYETDRLAPLVNVVRQQLGGGTDEATTVDSKVISDHIRAMAMILADGVRPSNNGRGYIPRRLIRKVISLAMRRSLSRFELADALNLVVERMGAHHPRLVANQKAILEGFEQEQAEFSVRVRHGLDRLETLCSRTPISLSGSDVLSLYATFGLPMEITRDYVRERGGQIDEEGFQEQFKQHQKVSRSGLVHDEGYDGLEQFASPTIYVGDENHPSPEAVVQAILRNGEFCTSVEDCEDAEIITDRTTFYAEGGGQVGDQGTITGPDGHAIVADTTKVLNQFWVHRGKVQGKISCGDRVHLVIDADRRRRIRSNHSATHLLQAALRAVLGTHVQQAGSRVEPDKLRFDFHHPRKVTLAEQRQIEALVNDAVRKNWTTQIEQMSYSDAVSHGALAFFGENYGERVRVVQFGELSTELCGGSHVRATGDIGFFQIVWESSVSNGVRRIVAVTGEAAVEEAQAARNIVDSLAALLKVPASSLEQQVRTMVARAKQDTGRREKGSVEGVASAVQRLPDGTSYVYAAVDVDPTDLREHALNLAEKIGGIVCITTTKDDRLYATVTVAKALTSRFRANAILTQVLAPIHGHGGGKPHLAQGGGPKGANLAPVFEEALRNQTVTQKA